MPVDPSVSSEECDEYVRDMNTPAVILVASSSGDAVLIIGLSMMMALAVPLQSAKRAEMCGTPAPVPAELAGWSAMAPIVAAGDSIRAPVIPLGRGMRVALADGATLRFARPPVKTGDPGTSGGMIAVVIDKAGRYRIALGEGAWIDVISGNDAVRSVAHAHGPACSPIRKMVDFDLVQGRYLIQIAGGRSATLPLMIVRVRN